MYYSVNFSFNYTLAESLTFVGLYSQHLWMEDIVIEAWTTPDQCHRFLLVRLLREQNHL